jgi:hypothetical protein
VYEADRGRSDRKTAEGSFSFMPISAAGVLYAEALLVSPFGQGCTGCTPSEAAIVAMLAVAVFFPSSASPNPNSTPGSGLLIWKGNQVRAALPLSNPGPCRTGQAKVLVRALQCDRMVCRIRGYGSSRWAGRHGVLAYHDGGWVIFCSDSGGGIGQGMGRMERDKGTGTVVQWKSQGERYGLAAADVLAW